MSLNPFLLDLSGIKHERFQATFTDTAGSVSARTEFTWRTETAAFEEDLKFLESLALFPNPDAQFHKDFGHKLYRVLLGGDVGAEYERQLAVASSPLPLILRIDPQTAQSLTRLPWELLHDGKEFLALNPRTAISRLPYGVPLRTVGAVPGTLRLLVVVANPDDLPDQGRLDVEAERESILAATEELQREGRLGVDFLEDASLGAIEDALEATRYHILHITGHGDFDRKTKHGVLLLEDEHGGTERVTGSEFVKALRGSDLRLIVLSACRTATAAHRAAYRDLGSHLAASFPASLAMQYPIADVAATDFAEKLYRAVCRGDDLHTAIARARKALLTERSGPAALATPVAYVSDPSCLKMDRSMEPESRPASGPLDFGLAPKMERGFVARGRELRQLRRKLTSGDWTAVVIHGIGGIGKSALASRLALRLVESGTADGVKVINCTPTLTADDVLTELSAFLSLAGDNRLNSVLHQPVPLQAKTAALAQGLEVHAFLVIFDNIEDCLKKGQIVSRAVQATSPRNVPNSLTSQIPNPTEFTDPDLGKQIAQLVGSVARGTRLLFTSRVDFEPVEPGRIGDRVGHVGLGELSFVAAAQLMNRRDSLANLPVASEAGVLTKRYLYEKLGGHPWALDQFARRAARLSMHNELRAVEGLRGELLAFSLIEKAVRELSERAGLLLQRAAVYEEPVPVEALAYLLGDEYDAMPDVSTEIQSLLNWGLVTYLHGSSEYVVHTLMRDWARGRWDTAEHSMLLRRAAQYWLTVGDETGNLKAHLNARHYFFVAGEYERAGEIVQNAASNLIRWGHMELVIRLLSDNVRTSQGLLRAYARDTLATVYQEVGDYDNARREHEALLAEFQAAGDRVSVARNLHALGMLHQRQGEYKRARGHYEQALAISREADYRAGIAPGLYALARLDHEQGKYERARENYEQALAISQELDDRARAADCLHQLGILHDNQGQYNQAREYYQQALVINQKFGNRAGVARGLHHLGNIHLAQGQYELALEHYEQSQSIFRELGDRAHIASGLQQLAVLHEFQGNYRRAAEHHVQAFSICRELGDRAGMARSMQQMGSLNHSQGAYEQASDMYKQALAIFQELDNQDSIAACFNQLGGVHRGLGEYKRAYEYYKQALAINRKLGDRPGVARNLHGLGVVHQNQGEYELAREHYEQALVIFQELGDQLGVAGCVGQIGRLYEDEGNFIMAVQAMMQAFVSFQQLGAPEQQIAEQNLARLREKMGKQAFNEALEDMEGAGDAFPSDTEFEDTTLVQAIQVVVENTVAVLAGSPDKKQEWWETLGEWQMGLREQGLESVAVFLDIVQKLVGGADPKILEVHVPTEFREAWQNIMRGVSHRLE